MSSFREKAVRRNVLLIEDGPGDVLLTREALHNANPLVELHSAADGIEALAMLRREREHVNFPRPELILLDLNLPRLDGFEVLTQIKSDDSLKSIPVVILTVSEADADIAKCYQRQANCFLTKPVQLDAFEALVDCINEFWLTMAKLPQARQEC